MTNDAFVENSEEEYVSSIKNLRLPVNPDGTIDWESASQKHKDAFLHAIKTDPNGILQNIQEEAGESVTDSGGEIADSTVVALANAIFIVEGVAFATIGKRIVPVLSNLHPFVAIKACTVTREDMEPVMEPAKRIVARLTPSKWLQYQDFAVVGEHLLKLSAEKFKACIDLAQKIEQMKNGISRKPNGGVVIDAQTTEAA